MPYYIGTDEAGYSPNLGPLVISAAVWWVAPDDGEPDLYRRLKSVVCRSASSRGPERRLAIADSKQLYSPALGLRALERGVLAALALADRLPSDWFDVWQLLDPRSVATLSQVPWHANYDVPVPLAAEADDLASLVPRLQRGLDKAGVRLVTLRSRAVFPDEFNQSTVRYGNKAEALSNITLGLLGEVMENCADEPVFVTCDKHGGRNQYGRFLQQQFPDVLVEVHGEGARESVYRFGPAERRVEVRFVAGGEAFLPAALASMASKYLRELAMRAFNDFWCGRVSDLAPTAGYPVDARRFKAAIGPLQLELGIADGLLWRDR